MGNINALRDWGHARDYVRMMWLMLQQDQADDFVVATGEQHSVRDFINAAAERLGLTLEWTGEGVDEVGTVQTFDQDRLMTLLQQQMEGENSSTKEAFIADTLKVIESNSRLQPGQEIVRIDPRYFRPAEVETLLGDPTKAREKLGWSPEISFQDLVQEMVEEDFSEARRDQLNLQAGFSVHGVRE
jgi:GDPmannose 4,6-dehydratase